MPWLRNSMANVIRGPRISGRSIKMPSPLTISFPAHISCCIQPYQLRIFCVKYLRSGVWNIIPYFAQQLLNMGNVSLPGSESILIFVYKMSYGPSSNRATSSSSSSWRSYKVVVIAAFRRETFRDYTIVTVWGKIMRSSHAPTLLRIRSSGTVRSAGPKAPLPAEYARSRFAAC